MTLATANDDRPESCITERQTPFGYWWRYLHSAGEPEDTWFAATGIAASVAGDQARNSGKPYLVSLSLEPRAVYVFPHDHPDTRKPNIYTALTITPTGERIRHIAPRR